MSPPLIDPCFNVWVFWCPCNDVYLKVLWTLDSFTFYWSIVLKRYSKFSQFGDGGFSHFGMKCYRIPSVSYPFSIASTIYFWILYWSNSFCNSALIDWTLDFLAWTLCQQSSCKLTIYFSNCLSWPSYLILYSLTRFSLSHLFEKNYFKLLPLTFSTPFSFILACSWTASRFISRFFFI